MFSKKHLAVLGLPTDANFDDVKGAYRKLALKYHPDRNLNDPEAAGKFRSVQAAYEALDKEDKNPSLAGTADHSDMPANPQPKVPNWRNASARSANSDETAKRIYEENLRNGIAARNREFTERKTNEKLTIKRLSPSSEYLAIQAQAHGAIGERLAIEARKSADDQMEQFVDGRQMPVALYQPEDEENDQLVVRQSGLPWGEWEVSYERKDEQGNVVEQGTATIDSSGVPWVSLDNDASIIAGLEHLKGQGCTSCAMYDDIREEGKQKVLNLAKERGLKMSFIPRPGQKYDPMTGEKLDKTDPRYGQPVETPNFDPVTGKKISDNVYCPETGKKLSEGSEHVAAADGSPRDVCGAICDRVSDERQLCA